VSDHDIVTDQNYPARWRSLFSLSLSLTHTHLIALEHMYHGYHFLIALSLYSPVKPFRLDLISLRLLSLHHNLRRTLFGNFNCDFGLVLLGFFLGEVPVKVIALICTKVELQVSAVTGRCVCCVETEVLIDGG